MEILDCVVIESFEEVPGVRIVRIKTSKRPDFKPGQYFQVFIPGDTVKPYSVSSPPSNRSYMEFCVKRVEGGHASNFMFHTQLGDKLKMQGPIGRFILQDNINNDIIFAATGTGISSIKPMIQTIFERGTNNDIWLFFGVRTENGIIYKKHFESIAKKYKNFHFVPCLSRASETWKGERGYVQDVMKKLIKDITNKDIYLCGVAEMVEQMRKIAEELGFSKEKTHFEKYV